MSVTKEYTIVLNDDDFKAAIKHIEESEYLTYDVESTGLNVRKDKIIGFGFCGKIGKAFYIPMFKWLNGELVNVDEYSSDVLALLKRKNLIMHNGSYDIRITLNDLGVDFTDNLVLDTMLMWHCINEEGPFGLKKICSDLQDKIGYDVDETATKEKEEMDASIKENGGSTTKTNYELYKADWLKIGYYGCADVDMTLRLFEYAYDLLEKEDLLEFVIDTEVMPLYKHVTITMESKGVKLDIPYIEENYAKLIDRIALAKNNVIDKLLETSEFRTWIIKTAESKIKISPKGKFAQQLVKTEGLDIPKSSSGKYSLTASVIKNLPESHVKDFLVSGDVDALPKDTYDKVLSDLWYLENKGFPININSKAQLADLVFNYFNYEPLSKTAKGQAQFNDTFVDFLSEQGEDWAVELKIHNRLMKIKTAYYDRFLENHEDGYYYFSYKQHGTISGRYGSDAQQLPRPMEAGQGDVDVVYFNNTVRRFFISGTGRSFIDADYESLEPHCFAHVSGDEGLRDIFRKGHDFYSTIAIKTEGLKDVSADKKAENYLGKVNKPLRQSAKAYSLGVPYGMGAYALGKTLEISTEEAAALIKGYLDGFPDLKKWMNRSKYLAQSKGSVSSETGRVRHLSVVKKLYSKHRDNLMNFKYRNKLISIHTKEMGKEEAKKYVNGMYLDYKNGINNSRNYQIQSLSSSIVNRSMIAIQDYFNKNNIDAWVVSTIHDQIIVNVPSERAKELAKVVEDLMTSTYKLSLDLKSPAEIGDNWRDTH